ncbi:MAG: hypothetical protein D6689_13020 [Deltaproteobacteria bacterium]|nr:MAG: hypothetical protein D6689_13020 [Deltaproteobacteria bacterium]
MIRWIALAAVAAGCAGDITGGDAPPTPPAPDAAAGEPAVTIASPAPGATVVRDALDPVGALAAAVDVRVDVTGPVARVEVLAGGEPVGDGTAVTAWLRADGPTTIRAVGFDAAGAEVAADEIDIVVAAPEVADCAGWLDLYGLDYEPGPDRQGVDDPVTVTTPINGVAYRYVSNSDPRTTFFMHCELAHALAKAAPILRERGVVEVADIGVYNYRCIGGGTPPDCPNGISQHAYAKAIDIAGFTTEDGTYYSVNDDWVIDPDDEPTCAAAVENDKDAFLHEIVCAMKAAGVWNIALTPNYNDAHRNHFHVDLTEGSDFIRRQIGTRAGANRAPLAD